MNRHKVASAQIARMVQEGRKYASKLASIDFQDAFVYWNPKTGEYAVNAPLKKQAYLKSELNRVGKLPVTWFTKEASAETGWVPIFWPKWYSPLKEMRKYADWAGTPAKTTLTGALIGTALGGGLSYMRDSLPAYDEEGNELEPWTRGEKLRRALVPSLLGAGVGAAPGMWSAWNNSRATRLKDSKGGYTKPDVGFWGSMFSNKNTLAQNSGNYRMNQALWDARKKAYGPRVKTALFDAPTPDNSLINVDSFNRTIWNDAANGAVTPNNALIVTSTLNASRPTGTSMITPGAVVGTLINAGVGYATAGAVGKALGAMNLISPAGQETLRNIGMWGGMINGIGNAILH